MPKALSFLRWITLASLAVCTGCAARAPSPPSNGGGREARPPRMNRALLLSDGHAERVVVRVDWIAGAEPETAALEALARWLGRATGRPESVEVERGKEVARGPGVGRAALSETVLANAPPAGGAYQVYVLYWDRFENYRGVCWPEGALDGRIDLPVVTMFVRPIERDSLLWITRRKVESAVLIHEFGHLAGLVTSSREGGRPDRPGHCPDPACRMYWGVDRKSIRKNLIPALCFGRLPTTFCEACEADLAAGREGLDRKIDAKTPLQ